MIEQARQRVLEDLGANAGLVRRKIEGLVAIQLVGEQPVGLVADSEVQCEARADAPGIAEIPSGLSAAALLQFSAVLREKRECAQHEIGAIETVMIAETRGVAIELKLPGTVELRIVVEALANKAHTPHQIVLPIDMCQSCSSSRLPRPKRIACSGALNETPLPPC